MSSNPTREIPRSIPKRAPKLNRERITLLLLGSDLRKEGLRKDEDELHTDMMMVVSLEPATKAIILLSVPRDLYVKIPSHEGKARLNDAFRVGEESGYAGGGGRLAADTIELLLGIEIHHTLLVNFAVVRAVIDAIGPIRVCPRLPIYDDTTLRPDSNGTIFDFPAGCQDLNSEKLVQYASVRYNAGDDFGRVQRQQEIIKSIRAKVLTPAGLLNLVRKLPYLWRKVSSEIKTDMSFVQMCEIAEIAATVPKENIYSAAPSLRNGLVMHLVTADQKQVLVPSTKLRQKVQELFDTEPEEIENSEEAEIEEQDIAAEKMNHPAHPSSPLWSARLREWARDALIKICFQALIALSRLYHFVQTFKNVVGK